MMMQKVEVKCDDDNDGWMWVIMMKALYEQWGWICVMKVECKWWWWRLNVISCCVNCSTWTHCTQRRPFNELQKAGVWKSQCEIMICEPGLSAYLCSLHGVTSSRPQLYSLQQRSFIFSFALCSFIRMLVLFWRSFTYTHLVVKIKWGC